MSALSPPGGAEVIKARRAKGLTQSQAAQFMLVSTRTFIRWEHGTAVMHPHLFDWFVTHEPPQYLPTSSADVARALGLELV